MTHPPSEKNYSRWFTDWPSTHERVGQTVEVVAIEALLAKLEEMDLHDDTGDPSDEGYMHALNELREWLNV